MYAAYAETPGIVEKVYVEEGDTVGLGQPLARIKSNALDLSLTSAEISADLARKQLGGRANMLQSIEEEIKALQMQLALDSANYQRQRKLWEQGIGSQADLDARKLKYELGRTALDGAQQRLAQTRLQLENAVELSATNVRKSQSALSDLEIRSKIAGRVYALFKNEGELIGLQEPLAKVGDRDRFLLAMQVDEVDISSVALGQKVVVTLDAYPGTTFPAHLSKIYPQKNVQTQTFKVEATFDSPPEKLYSGLSGEANIIIQVKEDAMVIPIEYLTAEGKVNTDTGLATVSLGLRNMNSVEILSGIDLSTKLLKP